MSDLACYDDLDPLASEVDDNEALLQDLYHRLIEDPGSNIDDPERGLGVSSWASKARNPQWERLAEAEMLKDDRVESATATITESPDGLLLELEIETLDSASAQTLAVNINSTGAVRA